MIVVKRGRYELRVIDNRPTWAWTYGRWVYTPEIDARAWFMRARLGPVRIEVVKQR